MKMPDENTIPPDAYVRVGHAIDRVQEAEEIVGDLWLEVEYDTPLREALDNVRILLDQVTDLLWPHQSAVKDEE